MSQTLAIPASVELRTQIRARTAELRELRRLLRLVEAAERARDARRHYEAATAGERGQNAG